MNSDFDGITNVLQNKNSIDHFIFTGDKKISFTTTDCGKNFKTFAHPTGLEKLQFHPEKPDFLLMLFTKKRHCLTPLCLPNRNLYFSKNYGKTLLKVSKNVLDFTWAYQEETADKNFPVNRIILLKQTEGGEVEGKRWSSKYSVLYTDNLFKTKPKILMKHGNRFAMSTHFLFIAKVLSEKRQEVQLYVTRTGGKKYKFIPVKLPFPLLKQHSYTILDYTSRQVFIHVTHTLEGVTYGNIYKSDSSGSVFSLAVSNNVRNNYGYCDFNKIKGMHGVYLVNQYDSNDLSRARIQWENAEGPEDKERALDMNLKKRTRISFDKGGLWHEVRPAVSLKS